MVPDTKSSHLFASSDTLPITENMEKKCLHHWLDRVQTHQNPTSPSNIAEEHDIPPTKRRKRSPSLTSTSSTQITEESCSSDSNSGSLTCGTYDREREEHAELVTRTVMALSSILAEPRIIYHLPPGIRRPESAILVRRVLNKDFGMKLIPLEFKDKIEEADGEMPGFAYDDGGSLSPEQLETFWENIQEIYIKATECSRLSQDENAWSLVVYDILNFALRHKFNLRPTNIKLQTIEPEILPRLPHRDLSDISSGKVNYVFALFPRSSEIGESLWWFERERIPLGLTTDPGLSFTPLFAGIIVRDTSGNLEEARLQLSLLFAAQLEKLIRLSKLQGKDISGYQLPLMFGWTVFGSDWHLYYAYKCIVGGKETIYVNKAIAAICPNTTTDLYYGIFNIIDLVRRVATYLENVHWPWLRDDILRLPVNLGVQA